MIVSLLKYEIMFFFGKAIKSKAFDFCREKASFWEDSLMFTVGSGMLSSDVSYDFMLSIWALNWVFCGNVLEHCHAIQGFFPEERLVTLIASSWNFHLEISGKNIPSKMKFVLHPTTLSQSSKFKGALVFHPYFMNKDKRESKIHGFCLHAIRTSSGSCSLIHPSLTQSWSLFVTLGSVGRHVGPRSVFGPIQAFMMRQAHMKIYGSLLPWPTITIHG